MNGNTPLPKQIAKEIAKVAIHTCVHPDAEVLLEDVRQCRRRRWWLATTATVVVMGSLIGLGAWIYHVGEGVGSAKTELQYMQRAADSDRLNIGKNSDATRSMERENATRYNQIRESLIRIESRLENIERRTKSRR